MKSFIKMDAYFFFLKSHLKCHYFLVEVGSGSTSALNWPCRFYQDSPAGSTKAALQVLPRQPSPKAHGSWFPSAHIPGTCTVYKGSIVGSASTRRGWGKGVLFPGTQDQGQGKEQYAETS